MENKKPLVVKIQQKGVYSGMVGRKLYDSIKYAKGKEIDNGNERSFKNADDTFEKEAYGGIIIFSVDENADELSPDKLANWLKQRVEKGIRDGGAVSWTVGRYLDGRYTAKNGKCFGEESLSLGIIGISSQQLLSIAEDICEAFHQETALVKDSMKSEIYYLG